MRRRDFLRAGLGVGCGVAAARAFGRQPPAAAPGRKPFKLDYAPHFGMFKESAGDDLLAQLRFTAEQGFTAFEDNGMRGRPVPEQERIAAEMSRLGLKMGVFVGVSSFNEPTFASGNPELAEKALEELADSLEVAKRVNAKFMTVVLGTRDDGLALDYQNANAVALLKRCAALCEPRGVTMTIEPLGQFTTQMPLLLQRVPQAYLICKTVGSPSCKIQLDVYHQQATEGNLIPNLDRCFDELGYVQTGDNPGRKEPGTGEINFRNVFRHLHAKGYRGMIGMEHGNAKPGKEGELAVIEAYRSADAF